MLLLGRSDIAVKIIKRVVISVARLFDKELMALVPDQKGAEESITNDWRRQQRIADTAKR